MGVRQEIGRGRAKSVTGPTRTVLVQNLSDRRGIGWGSEEIAGDVVGFDGDQGKERWVELKGLKS